MIDTCRNAPPGICWLLERSPREAVIITYHSDSRKMRWLYANPVAVANSEYGTEAEFLASQRWGKVPKLVQDAARSALRGLNETKTATVVLDHKEGSIQCTLDYIEPEGEDVPLVLVQCSPAPERHRLMALEAEIIALAKTITIRDRAPARELTPRQDEVALLILRGLTLSAIAEELGISADTVKSHTREIRQTLGITGNTRKTLATMPAIAARA